MRFTIRDLIWLTVLVALGLGWLLDRSRLIYQFDAELHEKDVAMHSELERVEREVRRAARREVDAAWEKAMNRMFEDAKGKTEPATDSP